MGYPAPAPESRGQRLLDAYFERKVSHVERQGSLAMVQDPARWQAEKSTTRRQLARMLGLDPLPAREDLKPVITGTIAANGVVVERLHFQSSPGLYVTGNLYRPAAPAARGSLPAILYLCGHSGMKEGGLSFGNKTAYQYHGFQFARLGYVCLVIDTLQLGEIEGEHHGTYRLGKWWWVSRGYTPAGVEAWNAIRSVDYLETRPEVDPQRIGVTGRSGGGAYSLWVAALDDRIAVAAPTAGMTDLRNHVVDGCIEGHCDCMYPLNTQGWDFDRIAALVAPRPLLICNTDKDSIFPLNGVVRLYQRTRSLYALLGAEDRIGLHIAEGPHKDPQPLHTGAFHWFNRHLKGSGLMETTALPAVPDIPPAELRVFGRDLPADQINTRADQLFVPAAPAPTVPADVRSWDKQRDAWMEALNQEVFATWPQGLPAPEVRETGRLERDGVRMTAYDFESEDPFVLRLWVVKPAGMEEGGIRSVHLRVSDAGSWERLVACYQSRFRELLLTDSLVPADEASFAQEKLQMQNQSGVMVYFCPRGIGPTVWEGSATVQTHRLRRFALLGETLASTQVWDIRRSLQALRGIPGLNAARITAGAHGDQAANLLLASLFESVSGGLELLDLPSSLQGNNLHYCNILRSLDLPAAVAMAAARTRVELHTADPGAWQFPKAVVEDLQWTGRLNIVLLSEPR